MPNTKHIFTIFGLLFVLLSTNSIANAYTINEGTISTHQQQISKQNNTQIVSTSFDKLQGIVQPSVRLVESNIPTYRTLKNSKKIITTNSSFTVFNSSQPHYQNNFLRGQNNFTSYPFYIVYHRLLI